MTILQVLRAIRTLGQGVLTGIAEADEGADPIDLFRAWFAEAGRSGIIEPEAMALATSDGQGRPSVRMVLLKGVDERGFLFYTNYQSRKAAELDANPRAAIVFHWTMLQRQVRIEGSAERTDRATSESYFRTRPRGSRIGAWASAQSRRLSNREDLERAVAEVERRFEGLDVPLPDFWGGYRVVPDRIEFWQGRLNRLHDRLVFERTAGGWSTHRLNP